MPGPAESAVIPPHDKLAVGIGFRLADLNHVILQVRAQGVVVFHGSVPSSQHALRRPGPGIRVGEDRPVFLYSGIDPGDKADVIIRLCVGRRIEHDSVRREQVFIDTVHGLYSLLPFGRPREDCPGVALQMDPAFPVRLRTDFSSVFRDAPDIPASVPELIRNHPAHFFPKSRICFYILFPAQPLSQSDKMGQGPEMQFRYEGALAAAQIQTVIPVCPKALADPVRTGLPRRKIQDPLHVPVHTVSPRFRSFRYGRIRVGGRMIRKSQVPRLLYIFRNRRDQPEGVVGAGIFYPVDDILPVYAGDHRRRTEGFLLPLFFRLKPARLKQMQPVASGRQPA